MYAKSTIPTYTLADEFLAHGCTGLVKLACGNVRFGYFRAILFGYTWDLYLRRGDFYRPDVLPLGCLGTTKTIFPFVNDDFFVRRSLGPSREAYIYFAEYMEMIFLRPKSQGPILVYRDSRSEAALPLFY